MKRTHRWVANSSIAVSWVQWEAPTPHPTDVRKRRRTDDDDDDDDAADAVDAADGEER